MTLMELTPEALASLQPLEVMAYLRANGWAELRSEPGRVSYWEKPSGEELPFEVAVPLRRDFRDYAARVEDLLSVLRVAEGRPTYAVYRNLTSATCDLIRIRLLAKGSADGTVPLDVGAGLIEHARDLVMAGACVTAQPRVWYRNRRPTEAEDYLRGVRLGQTEVGSFVITVLSRVGPSLFRASDDQLTVPAPFERRVTTTLALALDATRQAAETAGSSARLDAFQNQVAAGVTVNLCDAVAGLAPSDPRLHDGIRFEFVWSPSRPQRTGVPSQITMTPDAVQVVAEAGRVLRQFAPLEEYELRGAVRRLERGPADATGVATVVGFVDGQWRNVRVTLAGEDYDTAVRAHGERLPVLCVGDLVRSGRSLLMSRSASFTIADGDDEGF